MMIITTDGQQEETKKEEEDNEISSFADVVRMEIMDEERKRDEDEILNAAATAQMSPEMLEEMREY